MWNHPHKLLLASGSKARRLLIEAASIPVDIVKSAVDERFIESELSSATSSALARLLAEAKVKSVAPEYPDRITIGADQVLDLDGNILHKNNDREGLADQLLRMQGRSHTLHSAVSIAQDGVVIESFLESASITIRTMDKATILKYIDMAFDKDILSSVGGYHFEGIGINLILQAHGNYSTILGFPLRALIARLCKRNIFII